MPKNRGNKKTKFVPLDQFKEEIPSTKSSEPKTNAWNNRPQIIEEPKSRQVYNPTPLVVQPPVQARTVPSNKQIESNLSSVPKPKTSEELRLERERKQAEDLKEADRLRRQKKQKQQQKEQLENEAIQKKHGCLSQVGATAIQTEPIMCSIVFPGEEPKKKIRHYHKSIEELRYEREERIMKRIVQHHSHLLMRGESDASQEILAAVRRDASLLKRAAEGITPSERDHMLFGTGLDESDMDRLNCMEAPEFSRKLSMIMDSILGDVTLAALGNAIDNGRLKPFEAYLFYKYFANRGDRYQYEFYRKYLTEFGEQDYSNVTKEQMAMMMGRVTISDEEFEVEKRRSTANSAIYGLLRGASSERHFLQRAIKVNGLLGFMQAGIDHMDKEIEEQHRFNRSMANGDYREYDDY